jgi:hypothetical protein
MHYSTFRTQNRKHSKVVQICHSTLRGKRRDFNPRPRPTPIAICQTVYTNVSKHNTDLYRIDKLSNPLHALHVLLQIRHSQYFSKIAHCAKDTVSEPKTQYAVNVNLLRHYFNASEFIPDNQQLLDSMPELLLPNLTFHERELTESAGLLSISLFDMTKLAQASLNDSQVFLDVGSIIADSLQKTKLNVHMKFSLRTIETIFTVLNPIISGLALFSFIRMYFKFQAITAARMLIRPPAAQQLHFRRNYGCQICGKHRAQSLTNRKTFIHFLHSKH